MDDVAKQRYKDDAPMVEVIDAHVNLWSVFEIGAKDEKSRGEKYF